MSAERLVAEWVPDAHVVYIGKADQLRRRLHQYARFGAGEPVGHWGGRLIWQLSDAAELLVGWLIVGNETSAREVERRMLEQFAALHDGRRPFGDLTG